MNTFLESALKAIGKIFWSIFLYAFSSIFFMVLVMSFMSGKFPPPIKEIWGQLQDAKKNFAKVMEMQKRLTSGANGKSLLPDLNSPAHSSETGGGGSNLGELAKLDGLSKMKDHNRELEEAFAAGGSETTTQFVVNQGSSGTTPAQDFQRMRFEIDVLKSQLAQARQDIESLKQMLPQPKPQMAVQQQAPQQMIAKTATTVQQQPQQRTNYPTNGATPVASPTPNQYQAPVKSVTTQSALIKK